MTLGQFLTIFGGTQAVLVGLIAFLGKMWLSRFELRLEKSIEKALHASQVQFDREFSFYQKLWEDVSKIRRKIRETISSGEYLGERKDLVSETMPDDEFHARKLALLIEDLWELIEANSPFFPAELRDELSIFRENCSSWSRKLQDQDLMSDGWFLREGSTLLTNINVAHSRMEEAIRDRLESLATSENLEH